VKTSWFARMADIPGIRFSGSPGVDRRRLAEAHVRPRVEFGHLAWPTVDGSTSASPAHGRAFGRQTPEGTEALVRWVWEGLELPGIPSDYHFLLQHAVDSLWSRRGSAPEGLYHMEVFGSLDLVLVEATPYAVLINEADPGSGFLQISTFDRMLALLEREGALRDAVTFSRRASRFGDRYRREDLEAKVVALDEETR
jgi:hypothetical protein